MPLVRRDREAAAPAPANMADAAATLRDGTDAVLRRQAARALASHPEALPCLAERLGLETDPAVREAILAALAAIGGDGAARALIPALRAEDAGLRNGAVETLRTMPAALPHLPDLLADAESDVRIMATELARGLDPAEATSALCTMLAHETHPNACGAALDVLTELGTAAALPTLRAVAERFAGDPFVPFAAQVAMARIESAGG